MDGGDLYSAMEVEGFIHICIYSLLILTPW